jgi:F0F1-type ATP synthase assembly protein I
VADEENPDKKLGREQKLVSASASAIGIEMVLAVVVGYLLGHWLDGRFGTGPWLTVVFSLAGVGAAVKAVLRVNREYKQLLTTP